jgi:hypothetical protein
VVASAADVETEASDSVHLGKVGQPSEPRLFIDQARIWEMETRVRLDFPSAKEMEAALRKLGYLYVAHRLREIAWWHCVVLDGVTMPKDDETVYHFMDPADGN